MLEVFAAFVKAAREFKRAEILWQAVWPPLLSLVLWVAVAVFVWDRGIALIAGVLPAFEGAVWPWLAHWAAVFLLVAAFGALTYATALVLVATVALPRMLALVAARDYPDIGRHGQNAFWGSLGNTLSAGGIFVAGWLVTLPLLLVPGALLVLPLCWTAWLNQRTFRFDALAEHATPSELHALVATQRARFHAAGFGTALAAHIPIVNLLAPAYTALVFVHLALGGLRRMRAERGVEL